MVLQHEKIQENALIILICTTYKSDTYTYKIKICVPLMILIISLETI